MGNAKQILVPIFSYVTPKGTKVACFVLTFGVASFEAGLHEAKPFPSFWGWAGLVYVKRSLSLRSDYSFWKPRMRYLKSFLSRTPVSTGHLIRAASGHQRDLQSRPR